LLYKENRVPDTKWPSNIELANRQIGPP